MRSPFSYMKNTGRPVVAVPNPRRSIREAVKDAVGRGAFDKASSPSTQMAIALNQKNGPTYAGTVPAAEKLRRRAANKRARTARQVHRRAAR